MQLQFVGHTWCAGRKATNTFGIAKETRTDSLSKGSGNSVCPSTTGHNKQTRGKGSTCVESKTGSNNPRLNNYLRCHRNRLHPPPSISSSVWSNSFVPVASKFSEKNQFPPLKLDSNSDRAPCPTASTKGRTQGIRGGKGGRLGLGKGPNF